MRRGRSSAAHRADRTRLRRMRTSGWRTSAHSTPRPLRRRDRRSRCSRTGGRHWCFPRKSRCEGRRSPIGPEGDGARDRPGALGHDRPAEQARLRAGSRRGTARRGRVWAGSTATTRSAWSRWMRAQHSGTSTGTRCTGGTWTNSDNGTQCGSWRACAAWWRTLSPRRAGSARCRVGGPTWQGDWPWAARSCLGRPCSRWASDASSARARWRTTRRPARCSCSCPSAANCATGTRRMSGATATTGAARGRWRRSSARRWPRSRNSFAPGCARCRWSPRRSDPEWPTCRLM